MPFRRIIREIRFTFNMINLFYSTIRTVILFLVIFLVFTAFNIPWYLTFIPGIYYFFRQMRKRSKVNPYKEIEGKYTTLKEKLRAARDNLDEGNVFVFDLHKEVANVIRKVNVSSFFNTRRALNDLLMMAFLSLVIIILAPFHVQILDLQAMTDLSLDLGDLVDNIGSIGTKGDKLEGEDDDGGLAEYDDIFGKKSVALLGDESMEVTFESANVEIDVNDIREVEERMFTTTYPEEIGAMAASAFEEQIPKDQQEIVKNYYKKIATEG
ncbi:hypothetical protein KY326_02500 [Candidatus Woesearchaeota archaeon]|nr:hypothetical protein [Candidatus Woesearchaeota archaeon]